MQKAELITVLNRYKKSHQAKYGIKRLGLFGSTARSTSTDRSDIDIVVELEKQDLYFIIGIKQDLEEQLGSKVDIISYRNKMNPYLKRRIDQEAVYA
ncbi:MAG: nucleotidyltransferase [Desulfobacteraceae bacterium]|nr:MAG: nucleotidyltransferase [Desulfobacteraceae bacterium]